MNPYESPPPSDTKRKPMVEDWTHLLEVPWIGLPVALTICTLLASLLLFLWNGSGF